MSTIINTVANRITGILNPSRSISTLVAPDSTAGDSNITIKSYNPTFQSHPFHMVDNSP